MQSGSTYGSALPAPGHLLTTAIIHVFGAREYETPAPLPLPTLTFAPAIVFNTCGLSGLTGAGLRLSKKYLNMHMRTTD